MHSRVMILMIVSQSKRHLVPPLPRTREEVEPRQETTLLDQLNQDQTLGSSKRLRSGGTNMAEIGTTCSFNDDRTNYCLRRKMLNICTVSAARRVCIYFLNVRSLCGKTSSMAQVEHNTGGVIGLVTEVLLRKLAVTNHERRHDLLSTFWMIGCRVQTTAIHHKTANIFVYPVIPDAISGNHDTDGGICDLVNGVKRARGVGRCGRAAI